MIRRLLLTTLCAAAFAMLSSPSTALAERGFGKAWGYTYRTQDWERFYHYPYVYYPQNYWGSEYYRSAEHLYFRYPPEMRIPVYNKQWFNYYPNHRGFYNGRDSRKHAGLKYHQGHHFILDVF